MTNEFDQTDAVDMDALFETGIDQDAAVRAERDMLPDAGWYRTQPPFTVTPKHFEEKDGKPARTIFTAFGRAVHREKGTAASLRFRFSLDTAKVKDQSGNDVLDGATKNFVRLNKAYKEAYGQEATKARELADYLKTVPVDLRLAKFDGDEGPMVAVVNITPARD